MMGEPVTDAPVVTDEEGPWFRQFTPFLQRVGVDRRSWRTAGILIPFLVLFVVLSVSSGPFLTKGNLLNILDQQSATLIMAAAGTLVLVGGGIDLSVGANYALSGVVAGEVALHHDAALAVVAGLAAGLIVGILNGVITTFFRINSLIATLAMSFIVSGVASRVTNGNLLVLAARPGFGDIARTSYGGVFTSVWIALVAVVVLVVVLARTTTGRYLYAAGGNAEAALLAGVRVNGVRIAAFAASGLAAAVAGIVDVSRVLSAQASSGDTLAFTVLAGIVVGGTSIMGGEGAVWRTVVGVLFIAMVGNGFDLLGANPLYEQITLGVILLLAVGADAWTRDTL
jgi:ribose transport system permease protein